jgi:hypothetical protein
VKYVWPCPSDEESKTEPSVRLSTYATIGSWKREGVKVTTSFSDGLNFLFTTWSGHMYIKARSQRSGGKRESM